jgi:tetratricopeptide (TPR) repeat protein
MDATRTRVGVAALLTAALIAVYAGTLGFPFLRYDDPAYVTENPHVRDGLTFEGVRWAFTAAHVGNWHPASWLSHMLDCELFGLVPSGHRAVNLLLHAAVALLLFHVLLRATGAGGASAAVAALFALHPQRVEVVAWVAQRKELLAALFGLLALAGWLRFARGGSRRALAASLAAFAASLMSKPTWVPLPALLLLLDLWPLGRRARGRALLLEKLPFLALSAAAALVALWSQGAGVHWNAPLGQRVANALVGALRYVEKTLLPLGLSPFYPFDAGPPPALVIGSAALVGAVSVAAWMAHRRRPWLTVGWFWFLVAALPTIGLVKIGYQGMADRYAYLPQIGLLIALVFAAREWPAGRLAARARAALVMGLAAAAAWSSHAQARYWANDEALFARALAVTERNFFAHTALARALARRGEAARAEAELRQALRLEPDFEPAHFALGSLLLSSGRPRDALPHLALAAASPFASPNAHYHLGIAREYLGTWAEAAASYAAELERDPDHTGALTHLAVIRAAHPDPSLRDGRQALELAQRACELTRFERAHELDVLAAASAEAGEYERALELARRARERALAAHDAEHARRIEDRLRLYDARRPVRLELPPG